MLSGRGLCDELITRPEESYRLCCVVVCDLETSRIGSPYIYVISSLRVKFLNHVTDCYKCAVNIMMTLGAPRRLTFKFQTLSNNKVEDMRTFELGGLGLAEHILCATRS